MSIFLFVCTQHIFPLNHIIIHVSQQQLLLLPQQIGPFDITEAQFDAITANAAAKSAGGIKGTPLGLPPNFEGGEDVLLLIKTKIREAAQKAGLGGAQYNGEEFLFLSPAQLTAIEKVKKNRKGKGMRYLFILSCFFPPRSHRA